MRMQANRADFFPEKNAKKSMVFIGEKRKNQQTSEPQLINEQLTKLLTLTLVVYMYKGFRKQIRQTDLWDDGLAQW